MPGPTNLECLADMREYASQSRGHFRRQLRKGDRERQGGTLGGWRAGAEGTEESCKATNGGEADRGERMAEEGPQPGY